MDLFLELQPTTILSEPQRGGIMVSTADDLAYRVP